MTNVVSAGDQDVAALIDAFRKKRRLFELFTRQIVGEFDSAPELNTGVPPVIHTIRTRIKDEAHLADKVARKRAEGRIIGVDNVFDEITDCAGIRVLHLYQEQFMQIRDFINRRVKAKAWRLLEKPVAYSWDPETIDFYKRCGLRTASKRSYYTSVHYLIAPHNSEDGICCEVQVRTLLEEVWGEIDHSINYPAPTSHQAVAEQLRVLSKLILAGSRLTDSIFRVHSLAGDQPDPTLQVPPLAVMVPSQSD